MLLFLECCYFLLYILLLVYLSSPSSFYHHKTTIIAMKHTFTTIKRVVARPVAFTTTLGSHYLLLQIINLVMVKLHLWILTPLKRSTKRKLFFRTYQISWRSLICLHNNGTRDNGHFWMISCFQLGPLGDPLESTGVPWGPLGDPRPPFWPPLCPKTWFSIHHSSSFIIIYHHHPSSSSLIITNV